VLRLRSQSNDAVEAKIVEIVDRSGYVIGNVETDLVHHRNCERIALAGSNAGRLDINPPACEMTQHRGCHGRTNRVAGAYKKNSARQIAAGAQRISPSSEERKGA
jgi:hypothetical protein